MEVYKFFDTDELGVEDYNISGAEYKRLMEACFKYCASVSFCVRHENTCIPKELEIYRMPLSLQVIGVYEHYYQGLSENDAQRQIRHYQLSSEVQEFLLTAADNIFQWLHGWGAQNPADPAFFRTDGSVFFSSVIHEGECTLNPTADEDISGIINCGPWKKHDNSLT